MLATPVHTASRVVARSAGPEEPFRSLAPDPLERVSLDAFLEAARSGLFPKPPPEVRTDHVAPIRASVLPDCGSLSGTRTIQVPLL